MSAYRITHECMDCGRRFLGACPPDAPAHAVFYVMHCGCVGLVSGIRPYYTDADGGSIGTRPAEIKGRPGGRPSRAH